MVRKLAVLLSSLFASSALCEDFTPYVVNGSDISATKYPSFTSLMYDRIDYDRVYGTSPYCGATLLTEYYVLTAAHCIYGSTNKQLFTSVVPQLQNESDFPYSVTQRVMVSEYYYPDNYNSSTLANDIAILKLADRITAVTDYAILADSMVDEPEYRGASSGDPFYAVGHGNTQSGRDDTNELQETQLSYVANASCNIFGVDISANLCMDGAATVDGLDNATCQGDSGGPLFWNDGADYKQVGITSFGPLTCGDPTKAANSVFTEVSDHRAWIASVLAGGETPKVTVTDAQRTAYLSSISSSSTSGDSGGGGSIHWLGLLFLSGLAVWRRRFTF
ncbi:serine protease [Vibrio brasiliensis]|uniref:S1 family peptidase n=1 Tax=Vibrio brasiliensis TaxID=170652 RepID=UPI001EFEDF2C|nr:serine protease [Vibrio brasiliensis]